MTFGPVFEVVAMELIIKFVPTFAKMSVWTTRDTQGPESPADPAGKLDFQS